jgi:hypothetical protein
MKNTKYTIYDDGGATIDRYTLRLWADNSMYAFNASPFHPQGFGQYCGTYPRSQTYKHLGKRIDLLDLPEQAQRYVKQILANQTS